MCERACYLRLHLVGVGHRSVADILPCLGMHRYLFAFVALHKDMLLIAFRYNPQLAVVVLLLGRGVVAREHHPRADFQPQDRLKRVHRLGESAFDSGVILLRRRGEFVKLHSVEFIHLVVVRGEGDMERLVLARLPIGLVAAVEYFQRLRGETVVAHLVEQVDELHVVLAIDVVEFDIDRLYLAEDACLEEIGSVVVFAQHLPFLLARDGRELVEVADEEHLHASERQAMAVAHMTQDGIDSVQQVGSDHTHFVYHQQLHVAQQAQFGLPQLHLCEELLASGGRGQEELRRQLEERVDGYPLGIDGCHPRRCYHHRLLRALCLQAPKQRGLARTRLPREEDTAVGAQHIVVC